MSTLLLNLICINGIRKKAKKKKAKGKLNF